MFGGGGDPFMRMFGGPMYGPPFPPPPRPHPLELMEMHSQMREMDRMMSSMMDPFGFLGGPRLEALEGPGRQRSAALQRRPPRDPFGFPDIFSQMTGLAEMAMNDPNSVCYAQSTLISMDPSGRPRVVEHSTRKSGDVRETRKLVRDGAEEEMVIGHHIGDREHFLEKKRDKDGNVRKQQRFRNLDEAEAEAFDREFQTRAERNLRGGDMFGYGGRERRTALEDRRARGSPSLRPRVESSSGPIITLPDDDEAEEAPSHSRSVGGPIIREISEEEAESSIPKRRKDMYGRFFRANDQ